MEKDLTVNDFFDSKEIKIKEIEEKFHLVTRYDIDMSRVKGCPHCKDTCNQGDWKSQSWTSVMDCGSCKSIIVTIYSDRMGGCHTDTVLVYEQKNRPMYELYYKCAQGDRQYGHAIFCRECKTESFDVEDIKNHFCKTCNKTLI